MSCWRGHGTTHMKYVTLNCFLRVLLYLNVAGRSLRPTWSLLFFVRLMNCSHGSPESRINRKQKITTLAAFPKGENNAAEKEVRNTWLWLTGDCMHHLAHTWNVQVCLCTRMCPGTGLTGPRQIHSSDVLGLSQTAKRKGFIYSVDNLAPSFPDGRLQRAKWKNAEHNPWVCLSSRLVQGGTSRGSLLLFACRF